MIADFWNDDLIDAVPDSVARSLVLGPRSLYLGNLRFSWKDGREHVSHLNPLGTVGAYAPSDFEGTEILVLT